MTRAGDKIIAGLNDAIAHAKAIRTVDEELVGKVADAICAEARRLQERGHSPEISGVQAENFARAAIEATGSEQLSHRVERLESGLKTVIDQFEKDFCVEGKIVDEAPTSFVIAWNESRAALTGEHNG